MRKKPQVAMSDFKIILADDELGVVESLSVVLRHNGYELTGVTNPLEAVEKIRTEKFDLLILDYIMDNMQGDAVVEKIREFNNEIYILLLTGHKDLAPPLETLRKLDIQGYCEKSERFDQLLLLIESARKSVSLLHTVKVFKDGLNSILESIPKIYQLQPIGSILEEILSEIMPFVNSENAFILIDDGTIAGARYKSIFKGIGRFNVKVENFIQLIGTDLMEQIGQTRINRCVTKLQNGVILPLIGEDHNTSGVIYIESSNYTEGLKLLEIYAGQASISINNAFLHSMVNMKNEELTRTYNELKVRYVDTIEALRLAVDAKDVYTRGHSDRVAFYAKELGREFGLSEEQQELLRVGGIFHDIGKIGTADDILMKNDKLNIKEYSEIKKHPIKGSNILAAVSMFKDVIPLVMCHHERIDGKGYPHGIKGDEIPFLAKILSVADAFDSMTSDRLYRTKLDFAEAKQQLIENAGTQFDADVVNLFLKVVDKLAEEMKSQGTVL
jgi:putative nucleotidyltransferase with HDIG domain